MAVSGKKPSGKHTKNYGKTIHNRKKWLLMVFPINGC